jgi:hypothetical protein
MPTALRTIWIKCPRRRTFACVLCVGCRPTGAQALPFSSLLVALFFPFFFFYSGVYGWAAPGGYLGPRPGLKPKIVCIRIVLVLTHLYRGAPPGVKSFFFLSCRSFFPLFSSFPAHSNGQARSPYNQGSHPHRCRARCYFGDHE